MRLERSRIIPPYSKNIAAQGNYSNLGVDVPGEAHRATRDVLAALGALKALVAIDGKIAPFPEFDRVPKAEIFIQALVQAAH